MKKPISRFLSAALAGALCVSAFAPSASAVSRKSDRTLLGADMSVSFETTIIFTEEQGRLYKEAMEKDVREHIEALTNELMMTENAYKEEYLEGMIHALSAADVAEVFDDRSCTSITLSNLPIGLAAEQDFRTAEIGKALSLQQDAAEAIIQRATKDERYEVSTEGNVITIRNQISFEEFAEGGLKMAESMGTAEGQGVKTFPKKKEGHRWGNNACISVVIHSTSSDPNIVHCNKCDDSENDSYGAVEWAVQGSDCAKSVRLGVLALSSNIAYLFYYNSVYCVIEAGQNVTGEGQNVYCNSDEKSGHHWNCSWFTGIGHTESFHIHT